MTDTMEIDSPPGTKVFFLNENGYEGDREYARKFIVVNQILTVKETNIGGWRTDVEFEELPGKWFNSVMFGVVKDGQ